MIEENIFYKHLKGIVRTAYEGYDEPQHDWLVAIAKYQVANKITEKMTLTEIMQQKSEFLRYVQGKKFDKNGDEIHE